MPESGLPVQPDRVQGARDDADVRLVRRRRGCPPWSGSTSLTAVQASELQRYYMRVKAMRERQALLRSSSPASVHVVRLLADDLDPTVDARSFPEGGLKVAQECLLRRGEISLSDLAPYERLYALCPFGAWIARACSQYFISEMSALAQEMMEYVKTSLTFLSPSGSLSIHAAHIALSKYLTQCDAAGAVFCNRELFMGVAAKFELVGDGHSAAVEDALDAMLEMRQPYRSSESARARPSWLCMPSLASWRTQRPAVRVCGPRGWPRCTGRRLRSPVVASAQTLAPSSTTTTALRLCAHRHRCAPPAGRRG